MNRHLVRLFPVVLLALTSVPGLIQAQRFVLPTPNTALFEVGGLERYLVGTEGKPYTTGGFGCVRTDGHQLHEGLDIRCVRRNRAGEPVDPVLAVTHGIVVHINRNAGLSTYGKYVVIQHVIDGVQIYSLYAHLSEIADELCAGRVVAPGQVIGRMGRTASTYRIPKDRAHLHFELNLVVNDFFPVWFKRNCPGERNDHGVWNGQNLLGLDPRAILIKDAIHGTNFNLCEYISSLPVLCRVRVRAADFPWLKRYPMFVKPAGHDPSLTKGYEMALTFNGIPIELKPLTDAQLGERADRIALVWVNEQEHNQNPCCKLVTRRAGRWELTQTGRRLVDLIIFNPD